MSVLLVEDSPERIKLFRQACIGVSLTNLLTAKTAIAWLDDHTPKLIFLDYDLHEHGKDIKESGCGADVVSWLATRSHRFHHTLIVIHSLNEIGAERMYLKLHRHSIIAARMPFVWKNPKDLERLLHEID